MVTAPLAVAAFGYAATRDIGRWQGDWWWGYQHLVQALPIVLVAVAATTAWDAGSADNGVRAWSARVPDSRWKVPLSVGGKAVVAVLLVQLAAVGFVAVTTLLHQGEVPARAAIVIGCHLAMVVLAAALGVAVGSRVPSIPAVVVAVGVLVVLLFGLPGLGSRVFDFVGSGSSLVGFTPSPGYFSGVALALVVSTVCAWLLAVTGTDRPWLGRVLAGGAAVPLVGASLLVPTHQFVPSHERPERCVRGQVEICVYAGYDGLLVGLHDDLAGLLDQAARRGIGRELLPSTYLQDSGREVPPGVGTISLPPTGSTSGKVDARTLALAVSTPLWCRALFADEAPHQLLEDRQVVYDWALALLHAEGELSFEERRGTAPTSPAAIEAVGRALSRMRSCAT